MKKNNQKTEMFKPLIFNKKINLKHKIIPLSNITNTIGPIRVFPTATREWYNSVYAYNQNSIKNLSIADKTLSRLVKSYFNLFLKGKGNSKARRIAKRFRRRSFKKIWISKAELKHTSSKVTVTLYTYNSEKIFLTLKLKKLIKAYLTSKYKNINPWLINLLYGINVYKKRRVSLSKYLRELKYLLSMRTFFKVDPYIESYLKIINKMITLSKKDKIINKKLDQIYTESLRKNLLSKEIKDIVLCKLLLNINKSKFEDEFLFKLKRIVGKIYNKEVEFNIVNLKTLYFNSDIFTEVIARKLKNRKNKLLRVLKSSLYLVKLPTVNSIKEKSEIVDKFCLDHLKNMHVNSVINKYNKDKDTLDQLLLDILPSSTFISGDKGKTPLIAYNENYINTYNPLDIVFNSLKNKDMAGVRLEAKGRLSRRFTASRSLFKVKWKGSIKNLDSSYKKLSSVLLRGHVKSNIQYTLINSKTRNGAFGIKGWISSK